MDDIKEELATQDPRAYLNSNPQPREWTLSAREMARISTVTPADLALTTEQLSPRKWGPVESFARAIPEGIASPATSIVESIGTADIALTGLGHSSPNMTKEEMTRQLQNAEYLRLYSRKSRAIRDARHEPSEIGTNLGAGVGNLITYALTAGVGGGAALFGLSSAQAAADLEAGLVDKYVSESGDEYLRGYTATDKALDTAAAAGYGVFSGAVESVFGVERLAEGVLLAHAVRRAPAYARRQWMRAATGEITKAQAKRNITGALLGRQAITGMVGEAIEEGIQSVGEDLTMLARGYTEDLSMDEIGKKALVAALYGAVLGGAGGTGLYYLNRRTIINKVNQWQESNRLKLSERETIAIADELLDTGRARVVDEINTRAEVLNGYGRAIDIVAGRIEQQIRSQGWTRSDEDLKKYSQAVAKTLTLPAILSANRAGVPLSEFLKLANLRVVNNVLYMDPINNADDVQNMIKEQQALVSDLNLRAKLDNADKEALTDARRRLALLKTLHKQLLLDEALTDVQLTDEQQARVGKAQKSAAKLGLKSEADFGSAKDSRSVRQQKYHDATMAWIANGDNRLLKQLIGGRVPQKITQALTSLSERLRQIQELHPDIDIRGDIVGALKKLENTNKDNFTQTTQLIDPNGRDVMPENVLLYNFLFTDQNTITSFLNNYLDIAQGNRESVARGESATGDTIAPLSKKDLYAQAFKMTDEQKRQQAIARGAEYESLFSKTGEIKDPNLLSAFVSYQNQFGVPVLNQAEFYAADLTEVKEFNKEVNADTVREYITNLIGQLLETGTKPLQVQVIGDHVGHIIKSNKKLNKTQTERQHKALSRLRSILKHAIRIPRDGTVDMAHNTRKSTLEHKANIQEYIYFAAPVKIGDVFYNVEFTTERMKGQDPNILNLYNVHVKETGDRVSKKDTLSPVSTQSIDKTSQNVKTLNQETFDIADQNARLDAENPEYKGDTIVVNGKECTVYNSNGERIAKSEAALRNFYNWFGDSKVVDDKGRPLVVYHGTDAKFEEFSKDEIGSKTDQGFYGRGFYFANYKSMASAYGENVMAVYLKIDNPLNIDKETGNKLAMSLTDSAFEDGALLLKKLGVLHPYEESRVDAYENIKNDFLKNVKVSYNGYYNAEYTAPDGNTYSARSSYYNNTEQDAKNALFKKYLSKIEIDGIQGDKVLDGFSVADYMRSEAINALRFTEALKAQGYDGVFVGDELVAFESNQIKSTENRGTFSPDTGNIYKQRKSVNAWYDPELQAIVLGKSYNELSLPHELQHYFLQKTWDLYKKGQAGIIEVNPEWMAETEKLFAMLDIDPSQDSLTTVQQERFAAMSEAYLSGLGVQNVDNLTFKEFLNWVPEKYIGLTNIGYLDEKGEIKQPVLDQEAIEFFNKWYGNGDLPTLPVSPEIQQLLNATDAEGAIIPSTQKIMNNREKQWGQESEEQQKADAQLWRAIGENTPGDLRAAIDAEEEVLHNTEFPDDRKMPERQSWFKTGVKDARQRMADIARKYLEKNKEHAESVAYGNPEYVDNDTGVDRGMLIRAVMETVKPNSKEYALLDHNLAIAKSMSASTLSLSGDISHQAYLDALREVESTREMKAAINYAGTRKGALDKWNADISSYIDTHMASVLATAPNTKEREIALKAFVEGAKTKFSGNTTNATLNQLDLTGQTTTNKEQFIKWANAKIREDSTAKLSPEEKKTLMAASVKAQAALTAIDSPDKAKAAAAAKDLRHWQFEKNKLMRANIGRFNRLRLAIDNLFGSYAPSAMLMSVNTLFVANIPSSALNNALVKSSMQAYYKNNAVDPKVVEAERERIYTVFKASSLNLAQMEKPTSPSLLHGEKYTTDGQPHWYDFTFKTLAWGDNLFRIPTFVDTLARIATKDANGDSAKATQLFQEYSKLNNQSDAAKLARKQALAVSNMGVFTQDGILAQGLNYIRDQLNVMSRSLLGLDKEGFGLGNLLAPFLKTGANVAEMGGRAAIAPVRGTIYAVKKLAGKEIPDIEKIALRTDWKYFAMTAAVTAAYAALTSDDDEWYIEPYESGKKYDPNKPYDSIKIAGGWVKLDVFGPLAIPLRVAAKLTKEKEKGWLDATLSGYSFGGQEFLGDLPLVNTVMDNSLGWAQKQPGQWAQSYAYTQANKLVPAQLKSLSRAGTRAAGIEAWTEPSESMKSVQRKFHRNYGLDGAQPTTNDYINVITNRLKVWPE